MLFSWNAPLLRPRKFWNAFLILWHCWDKCKYNHVTKFIFLCLLWHFMGSPVVAISKVKSRTVYVEFKFVHEKSNLFMERPIYTMKWKALIISYLSLNSGLKTKILGIKPTWILEKFRLNLDSWLVVSTDSLLVDSGVLNLCTQVILKNKNMFWFFVRKWRWLRSLSKFLKNRQIWIQSFVYPEMMLSGVLEHIWIFCSKMTLA